MKVARSFRVALALLVCTGVQAAFAGPLRATAEIRAVGCCSDHCDHPRSTQDASRCCEIAAAGTDAALLSRAAAADIQLSAAAVAPATAELFFAAAAGAPALEAPDGSGRAAPIFLRIRSLRL